MTGPVERAFELAKTGHFENFTQVKKALRRQFNVERELVGWQLAADITRLCREARSEFDTQSSEKPAPQP